MVFADLGIGLAILALVVIGIVKVTHKLNVANDVRAELDALKKKDKDEKTKT